MADIIIDGTSVISKTGSTVTYNAGTIGNNIAFPAGQVLFMGYDSYETQTTIGTTETPLMSVSWTTKGANSRVEAQAFLRIGDYNDTQGYRLGLNNERSNSRLYTI